MQYSVIILKLEAEVYFFDYNFGVFNPIPIVCDCDLLAAIDKKLKTASTCFNASIASIDSLLLCFNPDIFWTKHKLYALAWCFYPREASIQTSL